MFNNLEGAVFVIQNDGGPKVAGGSGKGITTGVFRKETGVGMAEFTNGIEFNNSGSVDIQSGTLSIISGGTSTGTFDMAAGAGLILRIWGGGCKLRFRGWVQYIRRRRRSTSWRHLRNH